MNRRRFIAGGLGTLVILAGGGGFALLGDHEKIILTSAELEEWKANRTRLGVKEWVQYRQPFRLKDTVQSRPMPNGDFKVLVDHLRCPCAECGHTYQAECEKVNCECCNESCT